MFSIDETFSLLTDSIPEEIPSNLVKKCEEIGMKNLRYLDTGFSRSLSDVDKDYSFVFRSNNDAEIRLEILEKDSTIMQTSILIVNQPSFFFSKAKKHFKILKDHSDSYYGEHSIMNMGGEYSLNYGNVSSICYLYKMKVNGEDVIYFKVVNRDYWQKYLQTN